MGGMAKKSDFPVGIGAQIGGDNPFTPHISQPELPLLHISGNKFCSLLLRVAVGNIPYICHIMMKKFNIIASHISNGSMQEAPSYEMGISKYARMRQEMKQEKKINMMAEAYRKAEESEPSLGMIMPMIKR